MALTIKEQGLLRQQIIRPDDMPTIDLLTIVGFTKIEYFLEHLKETDPGSLAESYKNKFIQFGQQVKQKQGNALIMLLETFVDIVKNGNTTIADVKSWTQTDWESQANNQIDTIFEKCAGITAAERTAYSGLPNPQQ